MEMIMDYKKNCINILRFIAAFQVMWGHLIEHLEVPFPLVGGYSLDKVISWFLYFFNGVPLFFFLSGFLIWMSIDRSKNLKSYYANRFIRIYPELWVGVLTEIIILLIFVTPIKWKDLVLFAGTQATVLQFWTPDSLRSFGCGTPNGSLWTICVMIQFYIIAWPLKKLCKEKKVHFWIITEICLIIIGAATKYVEDVAPEILYKLYCQTIVQYLWIFWLGMIIAQYKDKVIPMLTKYWYVFALGAFAMRFSPFDLRARNFLIIYTVFCLMAIIGLAYRFSALRIKLDISYALFIYHMLVVNVLIELGYDKNIIAFIVCIVISIFLAYLSTITVGRMALSHKRT